MSAPAISLRTRTFNAIALIIVGYLAYSIADLCSKILQETYSVYQVLSVSGTVGFFITGIWLYVRHGAASFLPPNLKLHLVRAAFVLGTAYFMVRSLHTLPMADFYGIVFIMPFLVMILAIVLLGEKVGWRRWTAAMVGFSGVLIIAGPQFEHIGEGVICALLGALCAALNIIWLRKIGSSAPRPLYGFYPFVFIMIFSILGLALSGTYVPFQADDLFYFAFHGPVIVLGIVFVSIGFATAPETAVVAPFHYTQILWGVMFGWMFFNVLPTANTWIGLLLITAAGLYSLWQEYKVHHPELH